MGSYRKVFLDRTGGELGCFHVQLAMKTRVARLKSIKIPHQDLKNPRMQHIFSKNPEIFLRCSDDVIYHRDEILTSVQRLFNFSILCNIVIVRIKSSNRGVKILLDIFISVARQETKGHNFRRKIAVNP